MQVTGPLSWRTVAPLADVEWAIRIIQHQGEGVVIGPLDSGTADLALYYRFLEIWKGKRLRFDKADRRFHWRGEFKFPDCRPMGAVPNSGYEGPLPPAVSQHLKQFDKHYDAMLVELENAWRPAADDVKNRQGALIRAYVLMFELGKHARPLMTIPIGEPNGPTYGPQFGPPKMITRWRTRHANRLLTASRSNGLLRACNPSDRVAADINSRTFQQPFVTRTTHSIRHMHGVPR